MKCFATIFLCLFLPLVARADQQIAEAQQNLKDLGFYYGDVTGEKGTETNDAVRRYQIRNGLNITGELNDETLQSLKKAAATAAAATPPAALTHDSPVQPSQARPQPSVIDSEPSESGQARQPFQAAPVQPAPGAPGPMSPPTNVAPDGVYDGRTVPAPQGEPFANTPYQMAPPEVQRRVVMDAQRRLAEIGLYKHPLDGNFGSDLEFSLRAYQSRVHLPTTGRLDLETLAALRLLPPPRHPFRHLPAAEPPVRGEWIRP